MDLDRSMRRRRQGGFGGGDEVSPSCILVKLDQFCLGQVEGLEASTIPLFPVVKTIKYSTEKGGKKKVQC